MAVFSWFHQGQKSLPPAHVFKVATINAGVRALQDPHLQKRLQQVLKLNKEKWEEAREHALKAVVVDNRMRVWWASPTTGSSLRIGGPPFAFLAYFLLFLFLLPFPLPFAFFLCFSFAFFLPLCQEGAESSSRRDEET
jgi:hypothetical protein